ncbi:hypothetical protein BDV59DRAFT_189730 [Aspergillus ambiguus]|uniref:uncharacterized protein n=1 Tax=Aspergillus ambiguus TaxID=176160 RepID=UPI003CCDD368
MQIWKTKTIPDSEVDFESLPPIVQRKFFSNAERLRIRLAQGDQFDGLDYLSNVACAPRPGLHSRSFRSRRGLPGPGGSSHRNRRLQKPLLSGPAQKLRKNRRPLPTVCLATQAEVDWFFALPPKIQQKHFSAEERRRLKQACWDTEILDPTDEALCRLQRSLRTLSSSEALSLEGTTLPASPSSIPYLDCLSDTSDDDMDESIYDSFRWLDEDGELDLTLDEYRPHVSSSTSNLPSRQRPSFRRTLSLNSVGLSRKLPLSVSQRTVPGSSQSSNTPSALTNAPKRVSTSRPPSRQRPIHHAPRSSTSSIDPSAQYYQDPEARLKLRVYLASPQKFDEAIEFGFPSLGDKENPPQRTPGDFRTKCHDFIGTFLEDDDASVCSEKDESHPDPSRFSYAMGDYSPSPHDLPFRTSKRQTWMPTVNSAGHRQPKNREMTLKMTLTRPDLRTDSGTPSPPAMDPLKPTEISSGASDGGMEPWETDRNDHSLMKKVWRRIRGQGS